MKKFISFLLTISICISLIGCSSDKKPESDALSKIKNAAVGSVVTFGQYEQNNNFDSKEPIEWIVLENNGSDPIILISLYILDVVQYDSGGNIWNNSSVYNWLNNSFYNTAFSQTEKERIVSDSGGNVKLLSVDSWEIPRVYDVSRYLNTLKTYPLAKPTPYASRLNGDDKVIADEWWLISEADGFSYYNSYVYSHMFVDKEGVTKSGGALSTLKIGVRPVIAFSLNP